MSLAFLSRKRKTNAYINGEIVEASRMDITDIKLPRKFKEASAVICNNVIHILGDTYHYRFVNGAWEEVSTITYPIKYDTAAIWFTNTIYIITDTNAYRATYAWDGKWTLKDGSSIDTCHVVYAHIGGGGVIYAVGKKSGSSNFNFYQYSNGWASQTNIPYDFRDGAAVTYNGEIHVIGSSLEDHCKKHYKWDGSSWSSASTLPIGVHYGKAVVYNSKIYVFNEDGKCLIWNGSSWTEGTPLEFGMKYGSVIVYDNKIYYMGGLNPKGFIEYNSQNKICGLEVGG